MPGGFSCCVRTLISTNQCYKISSIYLKKKYIFYFFSHLEKCLSKGVVMSPPHVSIPLVKNEGVRETLHDA